MARALGGGERRPDSETHSGAGGRYTVSQRQSVIHMRSQKASSPTNLDALRHMIGLVPGAFDEKRAHHRTPIEAHRSARAKMPATCKDCLPGKLLLLPTPASKSSPFASESIAPLARPIATPLTTCRWFAASLTEHVTSHCRASRSDCAFKPERLMLPSLSSAGFSLERCSHALVMH